MKPDYENMNTTFNQDKETTINFNTIMMTSMSHIPSFLFNVNIYKLAPLETFINIINIIVVYYKMYKSSATKYYFTQYLILNTIGLNLSAISCFLMLHYPSSRYCYLITFLNNVFAYWANQCLIISYLDRYLRMKNYLRIFGQKQFLYGINLTFLFISIILSSPLLSIGIINDINKYENMNSFYMVDCKIYNRNELLLGDFIELVFNIILPFFVLAILNTLISFKLIKSKFVLSKHAKMNHNYHRQYRYHHHNHVGKRRHLHKMTNNQVRFVLTMFSINVFSVLLRLPLLVIRYLKHVSYESYLMDNNTTNLYKIFLEKFFLYESVGFLFKTFYYVFPFFINFFLNPYFKKQIVKIFCFHV
jgi:hypothetical protein